MRAAGAPSTSPTWITVAWESKAGLMTRIADQVNVGRREDGSTWATVRQERSLPFGMRPKLAKATLGPDDAARAQALLETLAAGLANVEPVKDSHPLRLTGPGKVMVTTERDGVTTAWIHDMTSAQQPVADILVAAQQLSSTHLPNEQ